MKSSGATIATLAALSLAAAAIASVGTGLQTILLVAAAAFGLLAMLAGLLLLSQNLWRVSADHRQGVQTSARWLASEIHSMQVILGRFPECSLPTTGYSMTFGNLHALLELLDERQPDTVVEFGSGLSTLMISAWMKRRGRGVLHSFDHDEWWAAATARHLASHALDAHCRVTCVPLKPVSASGHSVSWYDLDGRVDGLRDIDLVVVDGPPSHEQPMARLPAVFALKGKLANDYCVVLDDALRPQETAVADIWRLELPEVDSYTIPGATGLAIFRRRTPDGQARTGMAP